MLKNLYISNSKKFPIAAIGAILIIFIVEISSWKILQKAENSCAGGDLIKMDKDLFCRNLKDFSCGDRIRIKYRSKQYNSWREIGREGPYDVIVIGTSVGSMGWVEMLRLDYQFKICNLTNPKFRGQFPGVFVDIISNYEVVNGKRKAILVYVDMTERSGRNFKVNYDISHLLKTYKKPQSEIKKKIDFPSNKLVTYIKQKNKSDGVVIMNIHGKDELFYPPDLIGLNMHISYSKNDYTKLERQLKQAKEIANQTGLQFAIITFPTKPQQYEWLINENIGSDKKSKRENLNVIKKVAQNSNIPILDMEEELSILAKDLYQKKGEMLWPRDETHVNEKGARFYAEIIKKFLNNLKQ
jgi:hypothetical protein